MAHRPVTHVFCDIRVTVMGIEDPSADTELQLSPGYRAMVTRVVGVDVNKSQ
jgi:hypothetical protein